MDDLFFEYTVDSFSNFQAHLNGQTLNQVVTERRDVFKRYSTLFALNRSKRPQPDEKISSYIITKDCLFDNLEKVATPLIDFPGWDVYAAPNPFAFNTGDHEIVFVKEHVEFLPQIEERHVKSLLYALGCRAEFILSYDDINSLSAGVNFGTDKMKFSAGASQPHLHAQIGAVYKYGYLPDADNMYSAVREVSDDPIHFVNAYMDQLSGKNLVVSSKDNFFMYCPFAPRYKDETHIISRGYMRITDFKGERLDELSNMIYSLLKGYSELGIESFNVEFLQDREENSSFLLIKFSPRESQMAYSELLGRYVVDRFPEDTVKLLKEKIAAIENTN